MQYFDIYNYLLGLMNRRIQYYSVLGVSKETGIDDDDVESASHILEEHGIVKSCGDRSFAFVGGVELMREFLADGKNKVLSAKFEVNTDGVALENITGMKWSLVKKEETRDAREPRRRRRRSMLDMFWDDDNDDEDDENDEHLNLIERSRKRREEDKARIGQMVTTFIEKKEGYDPIESSFSPHLHISYPDGTPFVFQYIVKDGSHYFTDNGLLKRYLTSVTNNLPQDIAECWIDDELDSLADSSSLTYEDGVMYSNVESSSDEEDLNGEISYFVKVFENFFTAFYKRFEEAELNEVEEFIVKREINTFLLNTYNADLPCEDDNSEDGAFELLTKIVLLHENLKKSHAINIAEQLISISRDENVGKNLSVFEKLLEIINSIPNLQFKILQKAVERVLK